MAFIDSPIPLVGLLKAEADALRKMREEEEATMAHCPHCHEDIAPDALPDGRRRCDNCGGEYAPPSDECALDRVLVNDAGNVPDGVYAVAPPVTAFETHEATETAPMTRATFDATWRHVLGVDYQAPSEAERLLVNLMRVLAEPVFTLLGVSEYYAARAYLTARGLLP